MGYDVTMLLSKWRQSAPGSAFVEVHVSCSAGTYWQKDVALRLRVHSLLEVRNYPFGISGESSRRPLVGLGGPGSSRFSAFAR